ncbi:MAG: tetratricopeptide repeat protein, partial [Myxococcales bacterium]|nr:tetratricopeptide repeat protein [Myxococcales bacterium]
MTQAEQLVAQAAQWQAAGRADMAAQLYTAALEQDPSKFAVRMQLAECLVALGQPDHAAESYLMVAQAYAARGRQAECLAICERIIAVAPHAFVYMSVGPMVRRIGRHARALCAKAAEAHLAAGRQTDGLQILRLGAELDPQNPEVRLQLARIYQSRHMNREAVEALSDAGNLLLQAKRYDDYVAVAQRILALAPSDIQTLRDLPRVYLELRKPHEAVRALGLLTRASPGDIVGYEILAQAFASIGRIDKALSVLERLVEELGATGKADKAHAILNHARYWRPTDLGFLRSLKRLEVPHPRAPAHPTNPGDPRHVAPEGTVVLSIADLVMDEVSLRAPAPGRDDGAVELTEAEGTLTLRIADLILDEMQQAAGKGVS